ncbi:uncharacterized protein I303_100738 [Kwoniella dejecticola CBS 10117]|uniref:Metallo-beta-lactamase domain-containing protein n=1 Tax=Kwoniella dejecticola CBS 10117 TaxID=1296121 RepID=A0A1A6AFW9_9TREE|nr:uncharacterized protein I303_00741 [Kwoniella dejecticola CBS 10117]OBR88923.1 hypothetical protein I303_00741 [Kwoniella dejecticola CBS 10117]
MAGIYNGHLLEFPTIRVDCFLPSTSTLLPSPPTCSTHPLPLTPAPNAQLFLLTHVHSDHLLGLSDSFTGKIICSPDTKRMLLALEAEVDRGHLEEGTKEIKRLKYPVLRRRTTGKGKDEKVVDRIEAVPYGHPKDFQIGYHDGKPRTVTITLLDANHCPGSTMFLITSPTKAVLHTGDVRADKLFLQTLRREPALQPFLSPISTYSGSKSGGGGRRVLDRIYLDTGAILGTGDMPDREPILQDLVEQMSLFPEDTIFFLDTWCFGWEFIIEAVARYFDQPVHVDRYKRSIYSAIKTNPYLLLCTTTEPTITRFHACERYHKCVNCRRFQKGNRQPVYNLDKRIVSVNMVEVKDASWSMEHSAFLDSLGKAALGEGPWPYNMNLPLARHSPLPELQSLVKLFKPKAVSPNTVTPALKGMDYYLLPDFMRDCVADEAYEIMVRERDQYFETKFGREHLEGLAKMKHDTANTSQSPATRLQENSKAARQSSRRSAMSGDQIFRLSGMPAMKPEELLETIGMSVSYGHIGPVAKRVEDYSTDEESPRKRRKGLYVKDESDMSAPEASTIAQVKVERSTAVEVQVKREVPPSTVVPGRIRQSSSTDKKPSRFSLGSDEKARIKRLMDRDRHMFEGLGD